MNAVARLLALGSRRHPGRLLGIVTGIAVGVLLALLLLAGSNALETRDIRGAWLQFGGEPLDEAPPAGATVMAPSMDFSAGQRISRLDLSGGEDVGLPSGVVPPPPGEFLASPRLAELIAAAPAGTLDIRYGTPAGEIPLEALPSPDTLAVVVGGAPEELWRHSSAGAVEDISTEAYGGNTNYQALAAIGSLALLLPAFLLVSVATQLGAAARAERTRMLRTIGASHRLVTRIALLETLATASIGAVLGVLAFSATRPLLSHLPVAGERLMTADLRVSAPTILVLMLAVICGAVLVAWWTSRRAESSPTPAPAVLETRPSLLRLLPVVIGLGGLLVLRFLDEYAIASPVLSVVGCFAMLSVGLLIAGPLLTWTAGWIAQRLAGSGPAVIASRRILRHPRAAFRAVAGVICAIFLVTIFSTAITAEIDAGDFGDDALLPPDALIAGADYRDEGPTRAVELESALAGAPGIGGIVFAYVDDEGGPYLDRADAQRLGAHDLPPGAVLEAPGGVHEFDPVDEPLRSTDLKSVAGLRVVEVIARTDGTPEAIERARTSLQKTTGIDLGQLVITHEEMTQNADSALARQFAEIGRLAIVIVTLLAASVLVVATVSSLYDRRRTIGLLHLVGMPSSALSRIIMAEVLIPLLGILLPTVALGWLTAWLIITAYSGARTTGWPDPLLALAMVATAVMTVTAIAVSSRAARRIIHAEGVRFE